jgi:acetylornithine deacetylase/succinyl-diaminopimelate desuccinylase-like protein
MLRRFCLSLTLLSLTLVLAAPDAVHAQAAAAPPQATPSSLGTIPDEAFGWLQGLIRINTTNPPGNESAAANYLAAILEKEGIAHEVLEITPGRGIVIGRLSSSAIPDPSKTLLLLAHLDVVGVTREKWSVDPFAAISKDGFLYGRGAIDDKSLVVANLAAIVALKRANTPLDRDVIFLADADEEQFGDSSLKIVIAKYWDKIAAGFALNEGGPVIMKNGKVLYVGIQTAEKVPINVTVIATGTSGHASQPRPDNAVVHLSAAIAKIGAYQAPMKMTSVVERYFEQIAKVEDDETSKWIRALEMPERRSLADKRVSEMSLAWNAMLRDTVSPTMLTAGVRANVIPSEARANLNVRLLPGDSLNDVLADLKKLVNDPQIKFEVAPDQGVPSPPSTLDSPLYQTIERVSGQAFPGAAVVPYLAPFSTDSAQLRLHNVQAYGLLPFPLTDEDNLRFHADDERIPLDSFRKGIEFYSRVVNDFVARKQ